MFDNHVSSHSIRILSNLQCCMLFRESELFNRLLSNRNMFYSSLLSCQGGLLKCKGVPGILILWLGTRLNCKYWSSYLESVIFPKLRLIIIIKDFCCYFLFKDFLYIVESVSWHHKSDTSKNLLWKKLLLRESVVRYYRSCKISAGLFSLNNTQYTEIKNKLPPNLIIKSSSQYS